MFLQLIHKLLKLSLYITARNNADHPKKLMAQIALTNYQKMKPSFEQQHFVCIHTLYTIQKRIDKKNLNNVGNDPYKQD